MPTKFRAIQSWMEAQSPQLFPDSYPGTVFRNLADFCRVVFVHFTTTCRLKWN